METTHQPLHTISWHRRLSVRIVAVFLGLLVLVQLVTLGLVRNGINTHAREDVSEQISLGRQVLLRLLHQNAAHLIESTRILASDFGFRAAMSSHDEETIVSALSNHGERLGAGFAILTDVHGHIQAKTTEHRGIDEGALRALMHDDNPGQGHDKVHVMSLGPSVYQMVAVPINAPLTIGWVFMGFQLDDHLLADMRQLTGMDVVVLGRQAQTPWRSVLSHLPAEVSESVLQQWQITSSEPNFKAKVAGLMKLPQGDHIWLNVPMEAPHGEEVEVLLLRSVADAAAPYHRLEASIGLLSLVGVAVFALGCALMARRVTQPVQTLTRIAGALAGGNYDTPVPRQGSDEIGALSQAFESMRMAVRDREDEIKGLAFTDALTHLPNWAQFFVDVQDAIKDAGARPDGACAVLMLNLDRFKHVNDVLGHDTGDELLQMVGKRLRGLIADPHNTVARLNGDVFAVLLRLSDVARCEAVAHSILEHLSETLVLNGQSVDVSAGIGMAVFPEHAADVHELMRHAEVALHKAKQTRVDHVVFRPDLDNRSNEALSLLGELRNAIDHRKLRLYVQPKVSLVTGQVKGAEALVRWQHPTRGLVPPMKFIPFAEQTGFIRHITKWLLEESARVWRQWADMGLQVDLSVNLSARDLIDTDLPERLQQLLMEHRMPAARLCLEITESAIMDDPTRAQQTLAQFQKMGVQMSIDDFGTGYSSLAYLKHLPVNELKVDRSFVMNMQNDKLDEKIVRTVIDLAHNLGLSVVAEGIEDRAVWDSLATLNCDLAQGYWIAKPMPSEQFVTWAHAWKLPERQEFLTHA